MKKLPHKPNWPLSLLFGILLLPPTFQVAEAANHREAPLTALDTKADITDWFAFVSYDDPTKLTMILNVDPLLEPSNGPNYFPFDPEILYEMKVDNNFDAAEDITVQFRFKTEYRLPSVFTGIVGYDNGSTAPVTAPNQNKYPAGSLIVPPAVTALDGAGSEGLGVRQSYTVTLIKGEGRNRQVIDLTRGHKLYAVPSNAGPRTMPDYNSFASQGIYNLSHGVTVFAGTVDDPFYIDLGATFDTLNFHKSAYGTGVPGVFTDAQYSADGKNFSADDVAGFNVNSIAIELPIALLAKDGKQHAASEALAVLGVYATTSRPRVKVYSGRPGGRAEFFGDSDEDDYVQIQRMGNPLINELLIGTGDKDKFSMSEPKHDAQFANYLLDPLLARVINSLYAGEVTIPAAPRLDLAPLVYYAAPICPGCSAAQHGPVADLLRINTGIAPTPQANRKRMGFLAGDKAGFPNGRRVSDDVTDIAAEVVAGVLNPAFNIFPNNRIADGVNGNDRTYQESFPYVAFANSARQSRHVDPGEAGCYDPSNLLSMINCPVD